MPWRCSAGGNRLAEGGVIGPVAFGDSGLRLSKSQFLAVDLGTVGDHPGNRAKAAQHPQGAGIGKGGEIILNMAGSSS